MQTCLKRHKFVQVGYTPIPKLGMRKHVACKVCREHYSLMYMGVIDSQLNWKGAFPTCRKGVRKHRQKWGFPILSGE